MKLRELPALTAALSAVALLSAICSVAIFGSVVAHIVAARYDAAPDFLSFYTAGLLARTGHAAQLYDASVVGPMQRALFPGGFEHPIAYPLPVFVAWLFAPISWLGFTAAYLTYAAFTGAVLLGVLMLLDRELAAVPRRLRWLFLGCGVIALPSLATIVFGQVDLVALAGLIGGYLLLRAERRVLAGLALCLVLVKPHFVIGVALLLLVRRDWRTLGTLAMFGGALLIIPSLLAGPATIADNVRAMIELDQQYIAGARVATMPNWRGFIDSVTNSDRLAYWLPGYLAVAAGSIAISLARWRGAPSLDRDYSIAVLLPLVVSTHLHSQSLVVLLLPAALALRTYLTSDSSVAAQQRAANALLLLFTLLFTLPIIAIQGLSLTGLFVLAGYLAAAYRWPVRARIAALRVAQSGASGTYAA